MKKVRDLMSLKGRAAVITGGAGHIGSAIAEGLAESGAGIVVVDIDPERCKEAAGRLTEEYRAETLALAADLAKEQEVRDIPRMVIERFGGMDILINCAAFVGTSNLQGWVSGFEDQSADTWRQALEVNLTSAFVLIQACTPYLKNSGHGTIINVSSIYGMQGPDWRLYDGTAMGNPAAYAASKGGILQFTRWLATTLAPEVRVNAISPGGVRRNQPEIFQKRYVERTPLGRMATEEDIKGAAVFLASDLSSYVTGHNLVVDGGWSIW